MLDKTYNYSLSCFQFSEFSSGLRSEFHLIDGIFIFSLDLYFK